MPARDKGVHVWKAGSRIPWLSAACPREQTGFFYVTWLGQVRTGWAPLPWLSPFLDVLGSQCPLTPAKPWAEKLMGHQSPPHPAGQTNSRPAVDPANLAAGAGTHVRKVSITEDSLVKTTCALAALPASQPPHPLPHWVRRHLRGMAWYLHPIGIGEVCLQLAGLTRERLLFKLLFPFSSFARRTRNARLRVPIL